MHLIASSDIDIIQFIRDGGTVVETLVVVWLLLTKRLIPGWAYQESVAREAKWERLALEGTNLARTSTDTLRQVLPAAQQEER